jgi:plastocyanin
VKTLALISLVLAASVTLAGPAAGTPPDGRQTAKSSAGTGAGTGKVCHREWRKKRFVRWVKRQGKLKRVVVVRKVRVRVCRPAPPPDPTRLGVKAWEFGFTLSTTELKAGDTIIELNNQGEDAHDLHVRRLDGGDELSTPETEPGQVNRIRFISSPGSYRLWCSLPNHATWGMDTSVTVTGNP